MTMNPFSLKFKHSIPGVMPKIPGWQIRKAWPFKVYIAYVRILKSTQLITNQSPYISVSKRRLVRYNHCFRQVLLAEIHVCKLTR